MTKFVTNTNSENASKLFAALHCAINFNKVAVPTTKRPSAPDGLPALRKGIDKMTAHFTSAERASYKNTGNDDVSNELLSVMTLMHKSGFAFEQLPALFAYEEERLKFNSDALAYADRADSNTAEVVAKVAAWLGDVAAVLSVAGVVGAEVMAEAATAPNKTIASLAIDLHVRDKLNSSAQAAVPTLAAGRGLMVLKSADIDATMLTAEDVALAGAIALFHAFPEQMPESNPMRAVQLRVGATVLSCNAEGVTLYKAAVQTNTSSMMPHSAVVAADHKALAKLQIKIDERLAGRDFVFTGNGGTSIEERRLRDFGKSAVTTH